MVSVIGVGDALLAVLMPLLLALAASMRREIDPCASMSSAHATCTMPRSGLVTATPIARNQQLRLSRASLTRKRTREYRATPATIKTSEARPRYSIRT